MDNTVNPKVAVIMPAYNAEKTVKKTYDKIPKDCVHDIILVDDCSKDKTLEVARTLPIHVIAHEKNKGYGGNQKTCYTHAIQRGADFVIMLHPDYQYDPEQIPSFIKCWKDGADVVYGSRVHDKKSAISGGMPSWKIFGNRILTKTMNKVLGTTLSDAATGYIGYSTKVLKSINFLENSDGYTFDEEALIQAVNHNFKLKEVPIPTNYDQDSHTISSTRSIAYGISLYKTMLIYLLHKYKIKHNVLFEKNPNFQDNNNQLSDNSADL
ncbi:MAG: glycosyltransferase family 2 protein [Nanoarchaeota archaeon]